MSSRVSRRSYLGLLAIALGYAVFQNGGSSLTDWNVCLLIVALVAIVYWLRTPAIDLAPTIGPWLGWAVLLFPCFVALQLIPLPLFLVRIFSPSRAQIADALAPVTEAPRFVPLSVSPETTFAYLFRIVGYTLLFLLIREIAWRFWRRRSWAAVFPLIGIAGLETAFGLVQSANGANAQGTYANKNHFAGLLEMILPIALSYGLALLWNPERSPTTSPISQVLKAGAILCVAALIGAGLISSVSKMGYVSGLCGLFAMGALGLWTMLKGWARWLAAGGLVAVFLFLLVFVPSDELMKGFGTLFSDEWATGEGRWPIWRDSLRLIRAYPLIGSGLGTYQTVFQKYQTAVIDHEFTFAHNDYLQVAAELGLAGFLIVTALMLAIFIRALRAAAYGPDRATRCLGLGCTGAIVAIGIHSLADFNMYIPANALVLAWISGIATSLSSLPEAARQDGFIPGRVFFRRFAIALAGLLMVYAPAWILFETNFRNDPGAERTFCRFSICDTDAVIAAEIAGHAGRVSDVPSGDLLEALRGDPAAPNRWCDLGEALLKAGKMNPARYCFVQGVALGPYVPPILFRASSFYFGLHENQEALKQNARVLGKTDAYDDLIFESYRSNKVPINDVLTDGLPRDPRAFRVYLRYLMGIERVAEAATVWNWVLAHAYSDERLARDYVNFLFADQMYETAAQSWARYLGDRRDGYLESTWLFNGDFEYEPAGLAFDWQMENLNEDVQVDRDESLAHTGKYSLRVRFGGKENVNYTRTWQKAFVKPGNYRFEAFVRTQGITTDRGIGFHIFNDEKLNRMDIRTEQLTGTNDWKKIEQVIRVPHDTQLLTIQVIREPSLKFDNQIGGVAWIDTVRLVRLDTLP